MGDVERFENEFLMELAKRQKRDPHNFIDCSQLVEEFTTPHEKHWIESAALKFKENGWGKMYREDESIQFQLNAVGISQGDKVAFSNIPLPWTVRIKNIPRSDWISFGSLVVSLGALVVSLIALGSGK